MPTRAARRRHGAVTSPGSPRPAPPVVPPPGGDGSVTGPRRSGDAVGMRRGRRDDAPATPHLLQCCL
ncbi:hypothetical protein [Jannaschia sp. R86511]|uniref:hypothetical protein n=1 Tax=Jannaschia sp. R86511 TaxID=3093853 RepID=UPI0036D21D96